MFVEHTNLFTKKPLYIFALHDTFGTKAGLREHFEFFLSDLKYRH